MHVIKRDGRMAEFDHAFIERAILKAFMDDQVQGESAGITQATRQKATAFTRQVVDTIRAKNTPAITVEDIQDLVEATLMSNGEHKLAREYVLYRERRKAERQAGEANQHEMLNVPTVVYPDGRRPLDLDELTKTVNEACEFNGLSANSLVEAILRNTFEGIASSDLDKAIVMVAKTRIETDPQWSYVTAAFLLNQVRNDVLAYFGMESASTVGEMAGLYGEYFKLAIAKGIELDQLDARLGKVFDLDRLAAAIDGTCDLQYQYLGLQTVVDRYLLKTPDEQLYELPQAWIMRVAMGLALLEDKPTDRAIEFYSMLSRHRYMTSTPTLFNSGTIRSQMSSCYLTSVSDDLQGIYGAITDNAMLSKFAGGLGNDWTNVRALGSYIKGTNGKSQGVVPFLKVVNDTAVAVNQGGKRKGAVCAYLETWHKDIEEYLELRKNTGDERRRCHDMNTANWVPDLFMERVMDDGMWTLFSPNDVPDLHDLTGQDFKDAYERYEARAAEGEIKNVKQLRAVDLWRRMLSMVFETGHPWITFKDPCNIRSPQRHAGVVHSSNLCTEITLNTVPGDEIAVCNLGSIVVTEHLLDNGEIDHDRLRSTVRTAVRGLDNVIDLNYYSVEAARNSNLRHRPIGLGLMGFQDALYVRKTPYASNEAVAFADELMEAISYYAIEASADLAQERGSYESFPGSDWSKGIVPIDTIARLREQRGGNLSMTDSASTGKTFDWDALRKKVASGMRNSNVMAIAPTATIANIVGVSQSIEPTYQNLYVKSNLSGEFTVINPYLVNELKARGLWDNAMAADLKYYDGMVGPIGRIPADLKELFAVSFEVEPIWLVRAAAARQKWIDQAQSLNLYMAEPSGKKLDALYKAAWKAGLKTTYYLRTMGASHAEKSTVTDGRLNQVASSSPAPVSPSPAPSPTPKMCSLEDIESGQCDSCS